MPENRKLKPFKAIDHHNPCCLKVQGVPASLAGPYLQFRPLARPALAPLEVPADQEAHFARPARPAHPSRSFQLLLLAQVGPLRLEVRADPYLLLHPARQLHRVALSRLACQGHPVRLEALQ